jgi:hypothetical protein
MRSSCRTLSRCVQFANRIKCAQYEASVLLAVERLFEPFSLRPLKSETRVSCPLLLSGFNHTWSVLTYLNDTPKYAFGDDRLAADRRVERLSSAE